jgi:hypothetical protein
VPKRPCTSPAEWRLQPGKAAEPLPAHYRLDCDFGTAVLTYWADGGSEPIYVCEIHAKRLERFREHCPDVRIIVAQSDHTHDPRTTQEPTQARVVASTKTKASAPAEAARSQADSMVRRTMLDPSVRSPIRDLTYGNSAKAMVDEAIWNLAPGNYEAFRTALQQGKSASEAAQAAGGQLAVVHRKISDYTIRLEAVLSESKAVINAKEAIDTPLEHSMLEIIGNGSMGDLEKDAAIQQLGAIQEWVKHGLQGDLTPLQANRITLAIGDRLNWGGTSDVSEEFKAVYRALYSSLKAAMCTAVPEAQTLHDRLTNLYAAKSDMETVEGTARIQS